MYYVSLDPKSHFYGFGTCKVKDYDKPGMLNNYFPEIQFNKY